VLLRCEVRAQAASSGGEDAWAATSLDLDAVVENQDGMLVYERQVISPVWPTLSRPLQPSNVCGNVTFQTSPAAGGGAGCGAAARLGMF
jgi:hypothetical protein